MASHPSRWSFYIAIHPVPALNMPLFYVLGKMSDETVPPKKQIFEHDHEFNAGAKRPDICACAWCQ